MTDELMKTITTADESDIQFWTNANNGIFKVWCFFVKKDNWVSDETRQSIIDSHKDVTNVEFIIADDHNIDLAFCIAHSDLVANITVGIKNNQTLKEIVVHRYGSITFYILASIFSIFIAL